MFWSNSFRTFHAEVNPEHAYNEKTIERILSKKPLHLIDKPDPAPTPELGSRLENINEDPPVSPMDIQNSVIDKDGHSKFKCGICNKTYKSGGFWMQHWKSHHPKTKPWGTVEV